MAKILVIGDIYTEIQYFVDTIPVPKKLAVALEITTITGSKMINASRIFSRLGNEIQFSGIIGDDAFGKIAKDGLSDYGIQTNLIKTADNTKTGQITVTTYSQGESTITIYFGANQLVSVSDIEDLENDIEIVDCVYSSTNLPVDCLYKLVELCNKNSTLLFLDFPNRHTEVDLTKIATADFVAPNRQEAELISGKTIRTSQDAIEVIKEMRKKILGNIIITLDAEGCVVLEKDQQNPVHYLTQQVQVIDETGSGDIFRAVLVSEYIKSKNIDSSIKTALRIATESVQIKGVDNTLRMLKLNV